MRVKYIKSAIPLALGSTFFAGYFYGIKKNKSEFQNSDFKSTEIISQNTTNFVLNSGFITSNHVVLIDWDNCLCNTFPTIQKRLSLVANEIERRHPECVIDRILLHKPWTQEFSDHLKSIFGDSYWQEAKVLYFEYMDHKEVPVKHPFPGAEDFLRALQKKRIPFVVVSNSSSKLVKHGIELFGWKDIFEGCQIIAADGVSPRTKPDPYHFIIAIKSLYPAIEDSGIHEVIVIGDGTDSDMLGALNLANVLAEHNIAVSAIWMTHNNSIQCRLKSFSNFVDLHKQLILPDEPFGSDQGALPIQRHT